MAKRIGFTRHATAVLGERGLTLKWVERAVREPEWEVTDPDGVGAVRPYRSIPELGGRTLRVVCVETELEIRVVTAFLDRRARRPE